MQFFQDLGSLVEERWREKNYREEAFPEIAGRALVEMAPHRGVDPWDIIRWLNTTTQLPEQQDVAGAFGNPPVTVFNGPRFYIDVYYWLDGTTSIHQHGFAGAFQVLLGSSIHSQYDFEEKERINAHFAVGRIVLDSVELLKQGDVRHIVPGQQHIHSLFHLDRPSATVTIRTRSTPGAQPQFNYHKPYFASDPFYQSPVMFKRLQCASLLLSMKHPEADDLIGELLSHSDFQTAFEIIEIVLNRLAHDQMEETFGLSSGKERYEALVKIASRRHGQLVELIPPVFEEVKRQNYLILRRNQITSNEHRFFLALLLNVPDRVKVLDLVRQRFPDKDPISTIIDWVEELANTKAVGSSEPNVLGITDFDDDYLFVLQCLLEGISPENLKSAFENEFSKEYADGLADKPSKLCESIRNSLLFGSMLLDSSSAVAQVNA